MTGRPSFLGGLLRKFPKWPLVAAIIALGAVLQATGTVQAFWSSITDRTYDVVVEEGPRHLGDSLNPYLFPEAPTPEGPILKKNFDLASVRDEARVHMKTRDLDPNASRSPTKLYLNGIFIAELNNASREERDFAGDEVLNFEVFDLPFDPHVLIEGKNEFLIKIVPTTYEYSTANDTIENLDDVLFTDVHVITHGHHLT